MAKTVNDNGYALKNAIPNKLLNDDGTITNLLGQPVVTSVEVYDKKPALPNKFLNPDGSYSTLTEIISGTIDTDIFIVVETLPATGETNKIYLVPNASGTFDEYFWDGTQWDKIGEVNIDLSNYYTSEEVDTNFLKKTNTTAYTPTQNYHPATKKYVDDNAVSFKPFPNSFVVNSTTSAFLNSITTASLPAGMVYLGQVSLSDMPTGVTLQAEVEVYIYPQNVVYCVMRSADVSPYEWECNSYDYRGWEAIDTTAKAYVDTNFLNKANTTAYTPTADYHPATKKYVDDCISDALGNVSTALDTINGEVV